jgi:hypothetical protein
MIDCGITVIDETCQRVASLVVAHQFDLALPPRSPPSVVPDILSPSAINRTWQTLRSAPAVDAL